VPLVLRCSPEGLKLRLEDLEIGLEF